MQLSFGKHKGEYLFDLPDSYIWWLYSQDFLKPNLYQAVKEEILERWPDKFEIHKYEIVENKKNEMPIARIKSIYRELANKYHPDHIGGNTAAMQAINEFMEKLEAI